MLIYNNNKYEFSLCQSGHSVEICQSGPEADERFLGGIYVRLPLEGNVATDF